MREVQEAPWDRQMQMFAGIQATIHNAWLRGENRPAFKPTDFYKPKRGGTKPSEQRQLADPLDPNGTQTVEEKKFMLRSLLTDIAQQLPTERLLPPETPREMPEWQRAAVEQAWADFKNLTQPPNPN